MTFVNSISIKSRSRIRPWSNNEAKATMQMAYLDFVCRRYRIRCNLKLMNFDRILVTAVDASRKYFPTGKLIAVDVLRIHRPLFCHCFSPRTLFHHDVPIMKSYECLLSIRVNKVDDHVLSNYYISEHRDTIVSSRGAETLCWASDCLRWKSQW